MKPYFICATPRTGTNLVCEALTKTGVAGIPDEYFGDMHVPRWKEFWGMNASEDYIARFLQESATDNGVWGVKVMMQYYDQIHDLLARHHGNQRIHRFDIIEETFGNIEYIRVTRRDKIAQAVSLHKAYQNFVWKIENGDSWPDESRLKYDGHKIDQILRGIIRDEAAWEAYFCRAGKRPYVIVYEDLVERYRETIEGALIHLGIDHTFASNIKESKLQRQWNHLSDEWKNRYLAEQQDFLPHA